MNTFVPWGELSWILSRLPGRRWNFLGCISHEHRCFEAMKLVAPQVNKFTVVKIFDDDPTDREMEKQGLDAAARNAEALGVPADRISDEDLLATIDRIEQIVLGATDSSSAVVIDITSFPKRWFFVIARFLHENKGIGDILYTYTSGANYANVLSFNPDIVRTLPTFTSIGRRQTCDVALVGIGFHSYSILDLFDIEKPKAISMLFPFPPGPPGIKRNWRFVERLEGCIKTDFDDGALTIAGMSHIHVGALDLPQNFHALRRLTDDGEQTSLVAPYGPKPVSLAMCLFSLAAEDKGKADVPAYYAQPTRYALDYTATSATTTPLKTYAYPTRLQGRELYTL